MTDYSGIDIITQQELEEKLRYDFSANIQVKEVYIDGTSRGVKIDVKLVMATRPETIERLIHKDYYVDIDGEVGRVMDIDIRKDIAIDDYFSIHQLKEMNFAIANLVASNLGATTQPKRITEPDDDDDE